MLSAGGRRLIAAVAMLLIVSAIYLAYVRGPALLLDLSALAGMLCF